MAAQFEDWIPAYARMTDQTVIEIFFLNRLDSCSQAACANVLFNGTPTFKERCTLDIRLKPPLCLFL